MATTTFRKLSPLHLLTLAMWGEARGEPLEGRVAVGCVVRNRVDVRRQSYPEVLLAPHQFSCFAPAGGSANYRAVSALAEKMAANDRSVFADLSLAELEEDASMIIRRVRRDVTGGADHYLTTDLYQSATCPSWAKKMTVTRTIGGHTFLRSA